MLIRNQEEFNLLILPIFYLLHGEAYNSQDPKTMVSYISKTTSSQLNVHCLKCKDKPTLSLEFKYWSDGVSNITVNNRGSPCHGLHYLDLHGLGPNAPKYEAGLQSQELLR